MVFPLNHQVLPAFDEVPEAPNFHRRGVAATPATPGVRSSGSVKATPRRRRRNTAAGAVQNLGKQGLVNVPFWEYWTSPYSSHYRPYTYWLGDVQWGHLMTHGKDGGNLRFFFWVSHVLMKACTHKSVERGKYEVWMDEKILYPMMAGCKSPNHRDNGDDSRMFFGLHNLSLVEEMLVQALVTCLELRCHPQSAAIGPNRTIKLGFSPS